MAEEKTTAINRIKSERLAVTSVVDKMNIQKLKKGMLSPITMGTVSLFLLNNVKVLRISFFLPTIVRTVYPGRTTIQQHLLTAPPYIIGTFFVLFVFIVSWRIDRGQIFLILAAPTVLIGYAVFLGTMSAQARYGAIFIKCSSAFTLGSIANANVSANVISDTSRAIAMETNVMFGNVGGLNTTWTHLATDAAGYHIRNGINIACCAVIMVIGTVMLFSMKADSKKRDRVSGPEAEEKVTGMTMQEVQDLDWKHPSFRWRP
ncbi:hypothetical protein BDZ85DRAFT_203042 [Elsinoe ampelina]|uniref:Major facilitator superfamily domain-containing protein n=1 Tax=Elsinoe ampelina TaxID=302913 RepID=A0A6A6G6I4_9PEZI|nr:hypothetical protein BDZ85DRAFT_203042 [Elsinoe ampelina]